MILSTIDKALFRACKRIGEYKIRFDRLRNYFSLITLVTVLSIKFQGRPFDWKWCLVVPVLILFVWIDKRYFHPNEIKYTNTRNPFVRHVTKELSEIKKKIDDLK